MNGRTRVVGIIGDPVGHSLSPALHNAAFAALGIDWVYVAFPVVPGQGAAAIDAVRTLGIAGLSVTMPHKAAVAEAVDRLSPTAARLGVVNTVFRHDDELVGDSTDGPGFVDALRAEHDWDPHRRRCVILGTGGAARAVCLALAEAGAAAVVVVGRDPRAASSCARLARDVGEVGGPGAAEDADLVVNATPVGMGPGVPGLDGRPGTLPLGLDPTWLHPGQLVADLVYAPPETVLLAEAARRGAETTNGLGMLVHQAARQFGLWTGSSAPVDVMMDAVNDAMRSGAA